MTTTEKVRQVQDLRRSSTTSRHRNRKKYHRPTEKREEAQR